MHLIEFSTKTLDQLDARTRADRIKYSLRFIEQEIHNDILSLSQWLDKINFVRFDLIQVTSQHSVIYVTKFPYEQYGITLAGFMNSMVY